MSQVDVHTNFLFDQGVFVSEQASLKFKDFEFNYLQAREKEKRILSIDEIRRLPEVSNDYIHAKEWAIRKKNINRFLNYLAEKTSSLRILDVGCGNGFFTNMMSETNTVVGVDVNLFELKQAAQAFSKKNLSWYFYDIMNESLPEANFDIITFCASFQYFDKPVALLEKCKKMLAKGGEIHIIDSPFYSEDSLERARLNSSNYYDKIEARGMSNYYHHNSISCLNQQTYQFMYKPNSFLNKLLIRNDSPFPWIRITR